MLPGVFIIGKASSGKVAHEAGLTSVARICDSEILIKIII